MKYDLIFNELNETSLNITSEQDLSFIFDKIKIKLPKLMGIKLIDNIIYVNYPSTMSFHDIVEYVSYSINDIDGKRHIGSNIFIKKYNHVKSKKTLLKIIVFIALLLI